MFTSIQFSDRFSAIPAIFVILFLAQKPAAEEVASEEQVEATYGMVSAVAEGVLSLCAFSAVIFFNSVRQKRGGKAAKKYDKLGYECPTPDKSERNRKEKNAESACLKKTRVEVSAEALQMAAERARLTEMLHQFAKNGEMAKATKALAMLEANYGTPALAEYSTIITMCSKAGEAEAAHGWIRRLQERGIAPNAVCFNAVINAHAKMGDIAKAAAVAKDMRAAGVEFDTVTYNTLIDACTRNGDAAEAQIWMKNMLAAGVKASVVSFGSVMRACAKAGLTNDLDYWIEQADLLGIELNMICFSAVINAFAKNGDIESADYWITRMIACKVNPSVHCFTGMVDAVLKEGDLDRATEIVDRMRELKVEPDAGIYSWLVMAACQAGRREDAQKWINESAAVGCQLNRQAKSIVSGANLKIPSDTSPAKPSPDGRLSRISSSQVVKELPADPSVDPAEAQACIGKRFVGTIKEYINAKFGYIVCTETSAIFKRDIFLSSHDNPEQFAKGQKVSFVLQVDRRRGLPRACELKICR